MLLDEFTIVRRLITHNDYVASGVFLPPLMCPLVENVMQVDVRKHGRYDRPLRCAYLRAEPLAVL
jgi:hypothetical protein